MRDDTCILESEIIDAYFDEFVNSRIHQVFGVSCLVFGMK